MYCSLTRLPHGNFAALSDCYFLRYCCKELKTAQINHLSQRLNLICKYSDVLIDQKPGKMHDVSKDSPIYPNTKANQQ